jgi:hypothetical protein
MLMCITHPLSVTIWDSNSNYSIVPAEADENSA